MKPYERELAWSKLSVYLEDMAEGVKHQENVEDLLREMKEVV